MNPRDTCSSCESIAARMLDAEGHDISRSDAVFGSVTNRFDRIDRNTSDPVHDLEDLPPISPAGTGQCDGIDVSAPVRFHWLEGESAITV